MDTGEKSHILQLRGREIVIKIGRRYSVSSLESLVKKFEDSEDIRQLLPVYGCFLR